MIRIKTDFLRTKTNMKYGDFRLIPARARSTGPRRAVAFVAVAEQGFPFRFAKPLRLGALTTVNSRH